MVDARSSRRDREPHRSGMLPVGDGHEVYWETWGNPDGTPVVFLHGGPGSGCSPGHRELFDPARFLVVFFDQRGCGRSTPLARESDADLSTNTTRHLIQDIERLRDHLNVHRWTVFGVSWGSTLGLAYAESHPDRVTGMLLGPVTTTTPREVRWITEGVARLFAPQWERFSSHVPDHLRGLSLVEAYARLLFDPDANVRALAAHEWCLWEDTHMSLAPGSAPRLHLEDPGFQLEFARLVTHYWSNGAFLGDTELMDGIGKLDGIPAVLVHGKYDVSSPIDVPWELSRAWDSAELVVIDDAGHGGGSMQDALIAGLHAVSS